MSLNLPTGGGDFTPVIKYNAKTGFWCCRDSQVDGPPMQPAPSFMIDLPNLQSGWLHFGPAGPQFRPDPVVGQDTPAPPEVNSEGKPLFKKGFRVEVFSRNAPMNGAREWMSNAGSTNAAMNELFMAWEQQKDQYPGMLPVVQNNQPIPISSQNGTNHQPVLEIVAWDARPAEWGAAVQHLPSQSASTPQVPPPIDPVPQQGAQVPPPAAAQQGQAQAEPAPPQAPAPVPSAAPGGGLF